VLTVLFCAPRWRERPRVRSLAKVLNRAFATSAAAALGTATVPALAGDLARRAAPVLLLPDPGASDYATASAARSVALPQPVERRE